ncbi:hypothetical protein PQR37_19275 [Paraburkholderia nemoris]|uniref:hypothetical protein n=1 Tax=Paraburkholderia nemoris TaxID=2793076 RepID=UPI0038BD4CF7
MKDQKLRTSSEKKSSDDTPSSGAWVWLGKPANQRTLRFIGGGIVAVIGVLTAVGVFHKHDDSPSRNATVDRTASANSTPSIVQQASASSGGTAVNILGSGNSVGSGKP